MKKNAENTKDAEGVIKMSFIDKVKNIQGRIDSKDENVVLTADEWASIEKYLGMVRHGIHQDRTREEDDIIDDISSGAYQMYNGTPKNFDVEFHYVMYSFERIAREVISGISYGLLKRGFTKQEIIDVLQSKQPRHLMDCDNSLEMLGVMLSESFSKEDD